MSEPNSVPPIGSESKEALEKRKLRLEITELRRPFFRRPASWLSLIAAVAATGGVVGQSILSNIKVERALLEAAQKQSAADMRIGAAEARELEAETRAQEAEKARQVAARQREELRGELVALEKEKQAIDGQIEIAERGLTQILAHVDELRAAGASPNLLSALESDIAETAEALYNCSALETAEYDKALALDEAQALMASKRHLPWGPPHPDTPSEGTIPTIHAWWIGAFDDQLKVPLWVAYRLEASDLKSLRRKDCWRVDPRLQPSQTATPADYHGSGYDRGHLVPRSDMTRSEVAAASVYIFSNIAPQAPRFNRMSWSKLEDQVRDWARQYDRVFVITGAVFDRDGDGHRDPGAASLTIGSGKVAVPSHFFKIIARADLGRPTDLIAFLMPNIDESVRDLRPFIVSVDHLEALTSFDFFPDLQADADFEHMESTPAADPW